ncbi:hypothetical protein E8E13_010246 [Curvularia kusanoi]|uniref:Uncharacterized protein n=1 Tax=Curvularia kusanoi TaxID=90978 RepID=A0A9P4TG67_CURKU|nr:hypothetical protein E8E13_010246 [Curvularia kusanoi]
MLHSSPFVHPTKNSDELASSLNQRANELTQETVQSAPSHGLKEKDSNPEDLLLEDAPIISPNLTETQFREDTPSTGVQPSVTSGEETFDTGDGSGMSETLSNISLSEDTTTPTPGSLVLSTREYIEQNVFSPCRTSLLELLNIIETGDREGCDLGDDLIDNESRRSGDSSTLASEGQPCDASDASGTGGSGSHSTIPVGAPSFPSGSKRPHVPDRDKSGAGEDGNDKPPKTPKRGEGLGAEGKKSPRKPLFPCPCRSEFCLGTNSDISDLIRSLRISHRIMFCIECCELLSFPSDSEDQDAEGFLEQHQISSCTRRCISRSCSQGPVSPHERTSLCPTKVERTLQRKLDVWTTIWKLVNPPPPSPESIEYISGDYRGNQHYDKVVRRTTRKTAAKKTLKEKEAVMKVAVQAAEIETKLKVANEETERCTKAIRDQNVIILGLLDLCIRHNTEVDMGTQEIIWRVCPDVFRKVVQKQTRFSKQVLDSAIAYPEGYPPAPDLEQFLNFGGMPGTAEFNS